MNKIETLLSNYRSFPRRVNIDSGITPGKFKVQVSIDYYNTSQLFELDGNYSTKKKALIAGEDYSKKEIDQHLERRNSLQNQLKKKLNSDSATKEIELRDWGKINHELSLSFSFEGHRKSIRIPDDYLEDIELEGSRIIDKIFKEIKSKLNE